MELVAHASTPQTFIDAQVDRVWELWAPAPAGAS
jgi:hypothetical protein